MSRVIELIKRYVTDTGQSETHVSSFRLSNEISRGDNDHASVIMKIVLKNGVFDQVFYKCLVGAGIYVEDVFFGIKADGLKIKINNLNQISEEDKFEEIEIIFSREKKPININQIINVLRSETIFGLPFLLFKNFPISNLKIYFGANQNPIRVLNETSQQAYAYKNYPYIIEFTRQPYVEFEYINDRSCLSCIKRPIVDYVDEDLSQLLIRHAYTPKVGIKISSVFPSNFFRSTVPLSNWDVIRENVHRIVIQDLNRHTQSQVDRISSRITEVHRRTKVSTKNGIQLSLVPINEVETVLLFQKIALNHPDLLPGGLKVTLLDYSPKDIDSICKFQLSPNHPEEIGPVEFEFSLLSFFKHGHDYRQVRLIICYTAKPLFFPYTHGGINYDLDKTGVFPKLTNKLDNSSIPCLIIEDLFK
jgi:hypothetical protein